MRRILCRVRTLGNPGEIPTDRTTDSSHMGIQSCPSGNATPAKKHCQRGNNLPYETVEIIRGYFEHGIVNSLPMTLKDRTAVTEHTSMMLQNIDVYPFSPLHSNSPLIGEL